MTFIGKSDFSTSIIISCMFRLNSSRLTRENWRVMHHYKQMIQRCRDSTAQNLPIILETLLPIEWVKLSIPDLIYQISIMPIVPYDSDLVKFTSSQTCTIKPFRFESDIFYKSILNEMTINNANYKELQVSDCQNSLLW